MVRKEPPLSWQKKHNDCCMVVAAWKYRRWNKNKSNMTTRETLWGRIPSFFLFFFFYPVPPRQVRKAIRRRARTISSYFLNRFSCFLILYLCQKGIEEVKEVFFFPFLFLFTINMKRTRKDGAEGLVTKCSPPVEPKWENKERNKNYNKTCLS